MKNYFLLLALILSTYSFAQKTTKNSPLPNRDVILQGEVIPATFPEGNEAFTQLLNSGFIIGILTVAKVARKEQELNLL